MSPVSHACSDRAEVWEDIFEEELFGWSTDESSWPAPRTRQMFTEWFYAELADAIIDLVPDDPLTPDDMDVRAARSI